MSEPGYNLPGQTYRRFCIVHKTTEMVNVYHKRCEAEDCSKLPAFNLSGEVRGRFCVAHAEPGMINVVSKRCQKADCSGRARFGPLGHHPSYCVMHKERGMIFRPTKQCTDCTSLGIYLRDGKRYCEPHVGDPCAATNLGVAPCQSCGLEDILTQGMCDTCRPDEVERRTHAKEYRIRDVLASHNISFIHDRAIETPICGKERPDFLIDCGTHLGVS